MDGVHEMVGVGWLGTEVSRAVDGIIGKWWWCWPTDVFRRVVVFELSVG